MLTSSFREEAIMADPFRVRVCGQLEFYARGFAAELFRLGYTPVSATCQLRLMAHLSRWLVEESSDLAELTSGSVETFLAARRAAGHTNYSSPKALEPLLSYLRTLGAVPLPVLSEPTPVETILKRYRTYLTVERGLTSRTARYYVDLVRPFVKGRARASGIDLFGLAPGDVTDFVLAECRNRRRGSAKLIVTALRSLLSFLHIEGELTQPLATAVPSVASWRLAGLPRSLEPAQVRKLLASCDRRRATGRRDFAILMLLVRLGMRAGEVVGMELNDIDWRSGEVAVRGKGDRQERLPLPSDVGEAIVGYLRRGRPPTAQGRTVFVRRRAPHQKLTSTAVTNIVREAGKRACVGTLSAHRLRHTAATQMLRAGAPLEEIGQVLRHRSSLSTAIYAKVDRKSLRTLARPWPGGAL